MGDIFSTSKSGNFPCWKIHHSARRFPHSYHVAPGIPMTSHLLTTFPRAGTWTTKNTWAIPLTSTTCAFFWAGEKWLSWHEFSKTMAYIRRVIMIYIYIPYAPCLVYLLTKLGDFVRALLLGFKLASLCRFPSIFWLVVWNMIFFPIYWECHHPNWRAYFSGGRYTTNQY